MTSKLFALTFAFALSSCARVDDPAPAPLPSSQPATGAVAAGAHTCAPDATVCTMPGGAIGGGEAVRRPKGRRGGAEGAIQGATGAPRLVELEMPGCVACAKMAPVVKSVVEKCSKGSASVVERVDVTEGEGEDLARRHAVKELPTFLALDAKGAEVMRLVGVQKPEALATLVAEVTGRACNPG